jgi:hypothetical protein
MLRLVAAAAAGFAGGSPPRRLPSGPLIVGYTGCDQQKVIAEAAKGVNVIIWFASNLVRNATTGQPQVATGLNHTCVAEVAQELRRRRLPTAHMLCVGGWDAPHPNTSFSGQHWFEAWDAWNRREAARPALGFPGYDGILKPVDTAAALASGSTTRPPLPQPWASALLLLLGSGPASSKPPASPPKAAPRLRTCRPTHLLPGGSTGIDWDLEGKYRLCPVLYPKGRASRGARLRDSP